MKSRAPATIHLQTCQFFVEQNTVRAADGSYERHPESFPLRVIAYVMSEKKFYELLMTGEAVPWGSSVPTGRGFDFWIFEVQNIHAIGVSRNA